MKFSINNETLYFEKTTKFKSIAMGVYIRVPFILDDIYTNSCLATLLCETNESCKTLKALDDYYYDHYGLSFNGRTYSDGEVTTICFSSIFVNPKFLPEKIDLLNDAFLYLYTLLTKPYYEQYQIDIKKDNFLNVLHNTKKKKERISYINFFNHFMKDAMCTKRMLPNQELIENVTMENLKKCYDVLIHSKRYFYISGDLEEEQVLSIFKKYLYPSVLYDVSDKMIYEKFPKIDKKTTYVSDKVSSSTSYLYMGYETDINIYSDLYFPLRFLAKMMGGNSYSICFKKLREERGLCYFVNATAIGRAECLYFEVQTSKENKEEVISLIKEIVEDFKQGKYISELLDIEKSQTITSIECDDDYVDRIRTDVINDLDKVPFKNNDELIRLINNIKEEDIICAAQKLRLDTIYFMEGD